MSLIQTRRAQMFPVLTPAQTDAARRFASAAPVRFAPGEVLAEAGQRGVPAFLVLSGEVAITAGTVDATGAPALIVRHGPGEMTGEVSQLAGRPALAQGRAGPEGCEVLPFDAPHLRAMLIGSAELGELLMRAFILRRTALIADGGGGTVLAGHPGSPAVTRLEGFLARNGQPYTVVDAMAENGAVATQLGLAEADLPVAIPPGGTVLRRPTEAELALHLGLAPDLDADRVYDVAVVGAGPAGLAASVYAASEGLAVLVLDARNPGGQAGASARIENYLGFPTGITGQALMGRAFAQAQKFGVEVAVPLAVDRLECGPPQGAAGKGHPFRLALSGGAEVQARTVVVASGARYRRPAIPNLADFEGAGVSYWASPVEARLCAGEEVALVGAGNSAGQAVAFLAPQVRRLHLVVRGEGLAASMSRYLIDRIDALPNVVLHTRTEVTALSGDPATGLAAVGFRHRDTGAENTYPIRHLFLFIGADPNTEWLRGCDVTVDAKGFVTTGADPASPLQTAVPGIFAIGDVRAGSTKRVAAAVGEGAGVVAAIHATLAAAR